MTVMSLAQTQVGDIVRISAIPDPEIALMAVRLGIFEGEVMRVSNKIPGGPIVLKKEQVEIALGNEICRKIQVSRQDAAMEQGLAG